MRDAATGIAMSVLGTDGDAASALACQLFDSVMEAEGVGVPAATVYDGPREGAVEATVRRVVGDVDGSDESLSGFVERVQQLVERETRLAASSTMEGNVERAVRTKAGRRVRFARVPTRSVPCPWCAMLASRGFVYWSSESAEAGSHHHCTCTIVPGVQGKTRVAGYDTEHYADVWLNRERYEKPAGKEKLVEPSMRISRSDSPIMQASDFEELNRMCEERLGGSLARSVESMDFDTVRMVAAGLDDVRSQFGITEQFMMEMSAADLGTKTLARVTDTAGVIVNSRFMDKTREWAVTLGRHEGGHLLEVYFSNGDTERFSSGNDAARILRRAFRLFKEGDAENCPSTLERAVFGYSTAPSRILAETGKKSLYFSEGLAEATERGVGLDGVQAGILQYIMESIGAEFRR